MPERMHGAHVGVSGYGCGFWHFEAAPVVAACMWGFGFRYLVLVIMLFSLYALI